MSTIVVFPNEQTAREGLRATNGDYSFGTMMYQVPVIFTDEKTADCISSYVQTFMNENVLVCPYTNNFPLFELNDTFDEWMGRFGYNTAGLFEDILLEFPFLKDLVNNKVLVVNKRMTEEEWMGLEFTFFMMTGRVYVQPSFYPATISVEKKNVIPTPLRTFENPWSGKGVSLL